MATVLCGYWHPFFPTIHLRMEDFSFWCAANGKLISGGACYHETFTQIILLINVTEAAILNFRVKTLFLKTLLLGLIILAAYFPLTFVVIEASLN